jgi:hypothetical protein
MAVTAPILKGLGLPILNRARLTVASRMLSRITLPSDLDSALARLKFRDTKEGVDLERGPIFYYGTEDSWEVYNIGFGLPGKVPNDIIVDLGKNTETGEISAAITKLCSNPITVYKDNVVLGNLAAFTELDTVFPAAIATKLA